MIGDSVADAMQISSAATAILSQGVSLDLEVAPCRRLEGVGCPYQGVRPPGAVELIRSLGSKLGPNVVIAVGYNDFEDQYAGNIRDALAALKSAGVKHVWWLTLRAAHHPYVTMNADIEAAAQEQPADDRCRLERSTRAVIRRGSTPTGCISTTRVRWRWRRSSTRRFSPAAWRHRAVHVATASLPVARRGANRTVRALSPQRGSLRIAGHCSNVHPRASTCSRTARSTARHVPRPGRYDFSVRVTRRCRFVRLATSDAPHRVSALPDRHVRGLLPDRAPAVVGANAAAALCGGSSSSLASYVFYGWWDWRFVFLLAASTVVNHVLAVAIYRAPGGRRPQARCSRSRSRSTSGCSRTSSTRTSS